MVKGAKKSDKQQAANSYAFFQHLWKVWKLQGVMIDVDERYRLLFIFYSAFINVVVTVGYPINLCMMMMRSEDMSDNIKNLNVTFTVVACSVKFVVYSMKLPQIREFESLLNKLDARISEGPEMDHFRQLKRLLHNIAFVFLGLYLIIGFVGVLSFIFSDERRLLYPAWIPFDWRESMLNYLLANIYQIVGIFFFILLNYVNDVFPAMALCVLSGHIQILSLRVANIGYNNKSKEENEREMVKCVKDQEVLYELFFIIEKIISTSMFIQFAVAAINICVAMAALLFYVSAPLDIVYNFTFFLAMPLEIFPTCYYGSDFQQRFSELHRAVFCSNWVEQSPKFKKDMIIFTERSLKDHPAMAGGMVHIHLNTFFSTCKGAYSLYAVIIRIK